MTLGQECRKWAVPKHFPARAGTAWLRLDQPSKSGRREMATRRFPRGAPAKISSEHAVAKP